MAGTAITTGQARLHALAERLRLAEASGQAIPPISSEHPELTVTDAYAVQAINVGAREGSATGPARVVGHKVGLTSRAMQEMLGVEEPDFGVLYDDRVHPSGATLDTQRLIAPRVEPEIAFVLGEDLGTAGATAEDVLAATAYVVPALEVIDSRIADWRIALVDTVADNASGAAVVLGHRRTAPADVDLAVAPATITVGAAIEHGTGAAVLGHPAAAVAWLAATLSGFGVTLRAGHVVLPGAMTRALPVAAGDRVVADFGALGSVEVSCR